MNERADINVYVDRDVNSILPFKRAGSFDIKLPISQLPGGKLRQDKDTVTDYRVSKWTYKKSAVYFGYSIPQSGGVVDLEYLQDQSDTGAAVGWNDYQRELAQFSGLSDGLQRALRSCWNDGHTSLTLHFPEGYYQPRYFDTVFRQEELKLFYETEAQNRKKSLFSFFKR